MLGEEVKRIALAKKGKNDNNPEVASQEVDLFQRKRTSQWNSRNEKGLDLGGGGER